MNQSELEQYNSALANYGLTVDEFIKIRKSSEFFQLDAEMKNVSPRYMEIPPAIRETALVAILAGKSKNLSNIFDKYYFRPIISFEEFISEKYLPKMSKTLFKTWKDGLTKFFDPNKAFYECVFTGSIGCVTGDTKIRLLDGTIRTIKDMSEDSQKEFWVYSWDIVDNKWKPGLATNVHKSGSNVKVIKVNLTNDLSVTVTPNHPFLLTSGNYVKAEDLHPGDSIQSLYLYESNSKFYKGYTCFDDDKPVHRRVAECFQDIINLDVHHKDFNKHNNTPENLIALTDEEHLTLHANEYWSREGSKEQRSKEVSSRMKEYQSKLMSDIHYGEGWLESNQRKELVNKTVYYNQYLHPKLRHDITLELITETAKRLNTSKPHIIARELNCSITLVRKLVYPLIDWIEKNNLPMSEMQRRKLKNHTVLSIEEVDNDDVYDLTVEGYHNYGIVDKDGNLIFTHNTGKSTAAMVAQAYNLSRITSLVQPQQAMGVAHTTQMTLLLMSVLKGKASQVLIEPLADILKDCPLFYSVEKYKHLQEAFNDTKGVITPFYVGSETIYFPNNIYVKIGSEQRHAIGAGLFGCVLDEAEFRRGATSESTYKLYYQMKERVRSRFIGLRYICLCLVSSVNSETGMITQYVKTLPEDSPHTVVFDYPIWEVRYPNAIKEDGYFYVMRGNVAHPSRVLTVVESEAMDQGAFVVPNGCKVIKVPKRYEQEFNTNVTVALMNLAGMASAGDEKPFSDIDKIVDEKLPEELSLIVNLEGPTEQPYDIGKVLIDAGVFRKFGDSYQTVRAPDSWKYCFTGDTKVKLLSGISKTMSELVEDYQNGIENYTYTYNKDKEWTPGKIVNASLSKYVTELTYVTLDNGEVIKSTPDHKYMLRNGEYVQAKDLYEGCSLMPLYSKVEKSKYNSKGYELIKSNITDEYQYTYKWMSNYSSKIELSSEDHHYVTHHKDFNSRNNNSTNLLKLGDISHIRLHSDNANAVGFGASWNNPEFRKLMSSVNAKNGRINGHKSMMNNWHGENNEEWRKKLAPIQKESGTKNLIRYNKSEAHKQLASQGKVGFGAQDKDKLYKLCSNNGKKVAQMRKDGLLPPRIITDKLREASRLSGHNQCVKMNSDPVVKRNQMRGKLITYGRKLISEFGELTSTTWDVNKKSNMVRYKDITRYFDSEEELLSCVSNNFNHKVVSVKTIKVEETPVYDLTIDDGLGSHNFVLDAGVVVSNCHLDMAQSGLAGISMCHKELDKNNKVLYVFDFIIQVGTNTAISFEAVRRFYYDLKYKFNCHIHTLTSDQYQSVALRQSWTTAKVAKEIKHLSVDRTAEAYWQAAAACVAGQVRTGKCPILQHQWDIIRISNNKPYTEGGARKDVSDSVVGSIYNAVCNGSDIPIHLYDDITDEQVYETISANLMNKYRSIT